MTNRQDRVVVRTVAAEYRLTGMGVDKLSQGFHSMFEAGFGVG